MHRADSRVAETDEVASNNTAHIWTKLDKRIVAGRIFQQFHYIRRYKCERAESTGVI